jgi:hypothetical protein
MIHHNPTGDIVHAHPLLLEHWKKNKHHIHGSIAETVRGALGFVYPRALYLRFSVLEQCLSLVSQTELETQLGKFLSESITSESKLHRIVCDCRNAGIKMRDLAAHLLRRLEIPHPRRIIWASCSSSTKRVSSFHDLEPTSKLLHEIRATIPSSAVREITLPPYLSQNSLFDLLSDSGVEATIRECDVINWNFGAVLNFDSEALSLVSPLVHSLGHSHGILAKISGVSDKLAYRLKRLGFLRPMAGFFLENQADIFSISPTSSDWTTVPMRTFSSAELGDIEHLLYEYVDGLVANDPSWFYEKADLTGASSKEYINQRVEHVKNLVRRIKQILSELLSNVVQHAKGIGYVMCELDQRTRGSGLSLYIGDTGIGFQKGLAKAYKRCPRSDHKSVAIFLSLIDEQVQRRSLPGVYNTGGRGLARVSTILGALGGKITVRSGSAYALFEPAKGREPQRMRKGDFPIQGTHIHILIPTA